MAWKTNSKLGFAFEDELENKLRLNGIVYEKLAKIDNTRGVDFGLPTRRAIIDAKVDETPIIMRKYLFGKDPSEVFRVNYYCLIKYENWLLSSDDKAQNYDNGFFIVKVVRNKEKYTRVIPFEFVRSLIRSKRYIISDKGPEHNTIVIFKDDGYDLDHFLNNEL
jgi:hypothetical protein